VLRSLVTANDAPSSPILVALMMKTHSSETSVLKRITGRNIAENTFFIVTAVEDLKPYVVLTGWAL
jgi:hypothetical protein